MIPPIIVTLHGGTGPSMGADLPTLLVESSTSGSTVVVGDVADILTLLETSSSTATPTQRRVRSIYDPQQLEKNRAAISFIEQLLSELPPDADPDLEQQKREFEASRYSSRALFEWPGS